VQRDDANRNWIDEEGQEFLCASALDTFFNIPPQQQEITVCISSKPHEGSYRIRFDQDGALLVKHDDGQCNNKGQYEGGDRGYSSYGTYCEFDRFLWDDICYPPRSEHRRPRYISIEL
jgi:hypothetical protein